jgi:hypothetical protein
MLDSERGDIRAKSKCYVKSSACEKIMLQKADAPPVTA